jgi:hypothetical protein
MKEPTMSKNCHPERSEGSVVRDHRNRLRMETTT